MQSIHAVAVGLASLVFVPALLSAELWEQGDHTRALLMLSMTAIVALIAAAIIIQHRRPD